MKVNRAKRKAAGHVLLLVFGVLEQCKHSMYFNGPNWHETFTPKEKLYVETLQKRIDQDAEACRKLAWRLIKT